MKASKLIKKLQTLVAQYGDVEVNFEEHWDSFEEPEISFGNNYGQGYPEEVQKNGCICIESLEED